MHTAGEPLRCDRVQHPRFALGAGHFKIAIRPVMAGQAGRVVECRRDRAIGG